jgi:hypothetical protein
MKKPTNQKPALIILIGGILGLVACLLISKWCISVNMNPWGFLWFFLPNSICLVSIGIYLRIRTKDIYTT